MSNDRVARIEQRLTDEFSPIELLVKDQSHLHAGHAGAEDGRGHFAVRIRSEHFRELPLIKRHRLVYDALEDMLKTDIHALKIDADAPDV